MTVSEIFDLVLRNSKRLDALEDTLKRIESQNAAIIQRLYQLPEPIIVKVKAPTQRYQVKLRRAITELHKVKKENLKLHNLLNEKL